MNNTSSSNYSYSTDPIYQDVRYTLWTQIYFITFGILAIVLNLYPIILFIKYNHLRNVPCNWIIIINCVAEFLIGFGILMRALIFFVAVDLMIIDFHIVLCSFVGGPCSLGYRIGQTIALLLAVDRLLAVWKPSFYKTRQGDTTVIINTLITIIGFVAILFIYEYGLYLYNVTLKLYYCLYFTGPLWQQFIPIYSAIVTIAFFIIYSSSLILFSIQFSTTKKQQAQAQKQMSTAQRKLFISISMVLCCYSIFYVVPSTLQMLQQYFGMSGPIFTTYSGYIIQYGSVFNGCLNATIYLLKHNEFKECSKQFIYGCLGKSHNFLTKTVNIKNANRTSATSRMN